MTSLKRAQLRQQAKNRLTTHSSESLNEADGTSSSAEKKND